jgi:hypothetical protein
MNIEKIKGASSAALKNADPATLRTLSDGCFVGGFLSIGVSILSWALRRASANEGHAERLGIFIGLWAPTFFILSNRFERYADRIEESKSSS